jgi:hypothetical protein
MGHLISVEIDNDLADRLMHYILECKNGQGIVDIAELRDAIREALDNDDG